MIDSCETKSRILTYGIFHRLRISHDLLPLPSSLIQGTATFVLESMPDFQERPKRCHLVGWFVGWLVGWGGEVGNFEEFGRKTVEVWLWQGFFGVNANQGF